jgi:uncharacterized protein
LICIQISLYGRVIENALTISDGLIKKIGVPVLPVFKEYFQAGYFPFSKELKAERIPQRLIQTFFSLCK